jgi:hypothetical protein
MSKKITNQIIAIITLCFAFICCSSSDRLVRKKYDEGFSLKQPSDWDAKIVDSKFIQMSTNEGNTPPFILVYPFFQKKEKKSTAWMKQNLPKLSKFLSGVSIEKIESLRSFPDEAAAKFHFQKNSVSYQGMALCSTHEKSGMLYIMAAPDEQFDDWRNRLLSILESFRFELPKKPENKKSPRPHIRYRSWQDPQENAFTVDIPKGWRVAGGTFRRASVDLVHVLQIESPDEKMFIQFNDSQIPVFVIPSQILAMAGFREGTWYSPGYGVRMFVKRYTPGMYFISEYLQTHYRPHLSRFEIVSQKDRSDIAASFNRIYSQFQAYGISYSLHAGEAAFRFEQDSLPYLGYGLAMTQVVQSSSMGGGNWSLALMIIYQSPESEAGLLRQISDHIFQSIKLNPQWVSSQQQLAGNVSQIVSQTNHEISKIISDSYWHRQATLDNVNRKFSNYILGATDVVDPATGETWKAEAGHNYYWRKDRTGQIAGTEIDERPDIDFSPLKEF